MSDDPHAPILGEEGEACATCAAELAPDQRYCLNCGTRRAEARVELPPDEPEPAGVPLVGTTAAPEASTVDTIWSRFGGVWGVAALVIVALTAGVVIGRSGNDAPPAAAAPVVRISGGLPTAAVPVAATGPTATTGTTQGTQAADEWPIGRKGFTVQLALLPKATTSQDAANAAKADATTKGATDVGVLDAETHGLDAGQLIVYAGVEGSKQAAEKRLKSLGSAFPDAKVVQVAAVGSDPGAAAADTAGDGSGKEQKVTKDELKAQEGQSVEDAQKQAKKVPKTTVLGGKAPPKDSKAPGGGSSAETIG